MEKGSEDYWTTEFKRGVLKLVILGLLSEKEYYGVELINSLKEKSDDTLTTEEGTIYPLLHRLENDGLLATYKEKRRKYYLLNKNGRQALSTGLKIWKKISSGTNNILENHLEAKNDGFN